jgi:hypothetical protein
MLTCPGVTCPVLQVLGLYRQLLAQPLAPDSYTFVGVFTALSTVGATLNLVEDIAAEMRKWGIQVRCRYDMM